MCGSGRPRHVFYRAGMADDDAAPPPGPTSPADAIAATKVDAPTL